MDRAPLHPRLRLPGGTRPERAALRSASCGHGRRWKLELVHGRAAGCHRHLQVALLAAQNDFHRVSPAGRVVVSGVRPAGLPAMLTSAPSGTVLRVSVPRGLAETRAWYCHTAAAASPAHRPTARLQVSARAPVKISARVQPEAQGWLPGSGRAAPRSARVILGSEGVEAVDRRSCRRATRASD